MASTSLPSRLRDALEKYPRQDFLHRFWSKRTRRWYERNNSGEWSIEAQNEFLIDQAFALVIRNGVIVSAQSQPSFVLRLLEGLQLQRSEQVLEVGFASGWLANLAGYLVGTQGRVHGIEIDRETFELALCRSAAFSNNFSYDCADLDSIAGQQFDVVISTSAGDFPAGLFAMVRDNGRISAAFRIPGGGDCTYLFRRESGIFKPYAAEYTMSVPSCGELALGAVVPIPIDAIELTRDSCFVPDPDIFGSEARVLNYVALRDYIYRLCPEFVLVSIRTKDVSTTRPTLSFGLKIGESIAVLGSTSVFHARGREAVDALIDVMNRFAGIRRRGHALLPIVTTEAGVTTRLGWVESPEVPRIFS